ncbi:hypothetical protein HY346_02005 [Candidatus Microgenomates bacterium]|nr:hypothetical protein [Candidatus Microgenomates bacterium]
MLEHKSEAPVALQTPTGNIEDPTPSGLINCESPTLADAQAWQVYLASLPLHRRAAAAHSALAQLSESPEFDGVTRELTCTSAFAYRGGTELAFYGPARVYGACEGFTYLSLGGAGGAFCVVMPSPYIEDLEDGLEQPVQTLLVPVFAIENIIH